MIRPPDVVEKYVPDATSGTLWRRRRGRDDEEDDSSEGCYTMEKVAKPNKKGDVWVVLKVRVLNVSISCPITLVGELAILTCREGDHRRVRLDPSTCCGRGVRTRCSHRRDWQRQGQEGEGSWEVGSCRDGQG